MWRVGDGHCIKAYSDNWIPNLISGRSSLCELSGTVLVKDLISPSRTWKENEVHLKKCNSFFGLWVDVKRQNLYC